MGLNDEQHKMMEAFFNDSLVFMADKTGPQIAMVIRTNEGIFIRSIFPDPVWLLGMLEAGKAVVKSSFQFRPELSGTIDMKQKAN